MFKLTELRMEALEPPTERAVLRERVQHSHVDSRYPDPSEILGVYPDLPWVWIDANARQVLGISDLHRCSPVLVTPSLRHLFLRMTSRFVVAALAIGAGVTWIVNRILSSAAPQLSVGGIPIADIGAAGVLVVTVSAAAIVIIAGARR